MANAVEIRDLHFSFGDLEVLRGLSLDIPRGQIVAILGGSGSGKSTLLKLIGAQLHPARGTVKVDGRNVHQLPAEALYQLRLEMGMMFQTSGLFTDLDVYENIAFPIRENFELPEALIRRLVLMKLHAVGLRGAHAMKPGDLSGGMTRRVMSYTISISSPAGYVSVSGKTLMPGGRRRSKSSMISLYLCLMPMTALGAPVSCCAACMPRRISSA